MLACFYCITLSFLQVGKQQNRTLQLKGENATLSSELKGKSAYINDFIDHGSDGFIQQLEDKVRHLENVKGLLKEVGYCTAAVGCCTAITGTCVHALNAIFECVPINALSGTRKGTLNFS